MPQTWRMSGSSPYRLEIRVKFKVDENLPTAIRDRLRAAGYDALTVLDQALGGASDDRIARVCADEGRVLVTCDSDFGNILVYPPKAHAGIILLYAAEQSVPRFVQLVEYALHHLAKEPVGQNLWIVEKDRIRIRGE
jgi:predicted nuclease of predicted toxin-antitoxin system